MTFHSSRTLLFAAALTAVVLGIVGCAPATSAPTSAGTSGAVSGTRHSPVKHHAPPAPDTRAPAAQVTTPCSGLITPQELTDWQGTGVTAIAPDLVAAGDLSDPAIQLPVSDYVRAAGGLDCLWAAAPFDHYNPDASAAPSYLEITVQFIATTEYNLNAAGLGALNGRAGECDVDNPGIICQLDDLVGGTWIEIYSRKAVGTGAGDAGIGTIENSVLAAIAAAGTPTGTPAVQTGTTPLGTQCTDFVSTVAMRTALGTSAVLTASTPTQAQPFGSADSTPVWLPSLDALKNQPCVFDAGTSTQASISWIPGGAWAWNEDKTQTLAESPVQSLHVSGEAAGDHVWIRCAAGDTACTVDLVLSGNWIEATVPSTSAATNKRMAATRVAASIVSKIG